MPHVLHLLGRDDDPASLRLSRLIERGVDVTLERRRVRHPATEAVACFRRRGDFDLVHVFGPHALPAATGLRGTPMVYSPDESRRPTAAERWLIDRLRSRAVVQSAAHRRAWMARDVISPVPTETTDHNSSLRQQLGFTDDEFVILLPGRSTRWAQHLIGAWVGLIVNRLHPHVRLVFEGEGELAERCLRFAHNMMLPQLLTASHLPTATLVSIADAALIVGREPVSPMPVVDCLAAGLPIVALRSPTLLSMIDAESLSIPPTSRPKDLAFSMIDVVDQDGLRQQLSAASRNAAAHFTRATALDAWTSLYQSVGVRGGLAAH